MYFHQKIEKKKFMTEIYHTQNFTLALLPFHKKMNKKPSNVDLSIKYLILLGVII